MAIDDTIAIAGALRSQRLRQFQSQLGAQHGIQGIEAVGQSATHAQGFDPASRDRYLGDRLFDDPETKRRASSNKRISSPSLSTERSSVKG